MNSVASQDSHDPTAIRNEPQENERENELQEKTSNFLCKRLVFVFSSSFDFPLLPSLENMNIVPFLQR